MLSKSRRTDKQDIKKGSLIATLFGIGRHNWIRTNDPHHVKVVL